MGHAQAFQEAALTTSGPVLSLSNAQKQVLSHCLGTNVLPILRRRSDYVKALVQVSDDET